MMLIGGIDFPIVSATVLGESQPRKTRTSEITVLVTANLRSNLGERCG